MPQRDVERLLEEDGGPPAGLFLDDRPLPLVLAADFSRLDGDRSQESERRPALMVVQGQSGELVEIPLEVNTRGRFRLQRHICPDPPLRLRFEDSVRLGTVLDGSGHLKLVTHCRDNDTYRQNVLEEYLAYRIYNVLTDRSFGVQLVRITYVDTSGNRDPMTRMGFLIEDEDRLAERLGGRLLEVEATRPNQFDPDQLGLMYLFHYMVGNVDWGTTASHNVRVLEASESWYPIPYDFDWSGLVDAPYAAPNRLTEPFHETVRDRLYWGVCMPGIDYQDLFERVRGVEDEVFGVVRAIPGLSPANTQSAAEFLEAFFAILDDPALADRQIVQACRPWL